MGTQEIVLSMRIFAYLSASISAIRNPDLKLDYLPKCNSCIGSSYSDCLANVWEEFCRDDKVCQVQERRRGGRVYSVESGCKEVMTCVIIERTIKRNTVSDQILLQNVLKKRTIT